MLQPLSDKAVHHAAAAWWSAQEKDETWSAKNIFPRPRKVELGRRLVHLGYNSASGEFFPVVRLWFTGSQEPAIIIDRRIKRALWP